MSASLVLERVSRRYGQGVTTVQALIEVSLRVEAGQFVAIMGPSGSGKSTLLSLAGGMDHPSEGRVLVNEVDLATLSRPELARLRRRHLGYVFQSLNLLPGLSAVENVSLPLELDGVRRRQAQDRAVQQLAALGLAERAGHHPGDLSGGEQQRVAIARALVSGAGLVLADEPTGALDSVNGEAVMRTLRRACDQGSAAIVVTHDAQLAAWADRVVFIRDGRITDETDPPASQSGAPVGAGAQ